MPHFGWYYLTFLLPLSVIAGLESGGIAVWMTPIWVFAITPVLDYVFGEKTGNVLAESEADRTLSFGYNFVLWAWPPVQLAILYQVTLFVIAPTSTMAEIVGATLSVGIMTGAIGITWAHELCHRTKLFERVLAEILLTCVAYAHFSIEHVYGHHKNVATPRDPASARYGEGFYRFLPRTIIGSYRNAWIIEKHQLAKKKLPFWHYRNRMLRYGVVQILLLFGIYGFAGGVGIGFYLGQAIIAIILLELINYLEHYGLQRQADKNGKYERVQPWHSWNSSHVVSNLYLINLARHSDHHYNASRRYQILRHFENAPQLPLGYAALLIVALIPPLWFRLMNPRVQRWQEKYLL
ncbi:hypothetical protein A9Q83_16490 [Alphaproteobacteria bacterium 46_93_T64]|nr:hypothetical protein A9Q83_16490 [Alphaproteobacteria bacterium 46_93_T64]